MQNPRLATRYAKALLDLSVEKNILEVTLTDIQLLDSICVQNPDFVGVLRSPVIHHEKKAHIVDAILSNHISHLTLSFLHLLILKGRELFLPEIVAAFSSQYNILKNIKIVKLCTAVAIDHETKETILRKINAFLPGDTIEMKMNVDENLIGGFVIEMEDKLYDASIKKSISDVKSEFKENFYVGKI